MKTKSTHNIMKTFTMKYIGGVWAAAVWHERRQYRTGVG